MTQVDVRPDGCWMFKNRKTSMYGTFTLSTGRPTTAHRASWIMHNGEIPKGMVICHKCDAPGCVNPDHLFLGTQSENIRDCIAKGRGNRRTGAKSQSAVLSEKQVLDIRSLYGRMSCAAVGRMYGMSHATIHKIWCGHSWAHLGPVPGYRYLNNHLSAKKTAEIMECARTTGLSTRKVGRVFNVSGETVRAIIKKHVT